MVQCTSIINVAILHSPSVHHMTVEVMFWSFWLFETGLYAIETKHWQKLSVSEFVTGEPQICFRQRTVYSMHEKSSKGRSNLISNTCLVPTSSSSISQIPRSVVREPSAPPAHLEAGTGYLSAPLSLDESPPTQSSASLIKAIREELLRLSQKQSYHSWGSSDPTC